MSLKKNFINLFREKDTQRVIVGLLIFFAPIALIIFWFVWGFLTSPGGTG